MAEPLPSRIRILQGDITRLDVEAVVNAANGALAPGGGVCGAIHAAAGPELETACRALGGCPEGGARITPGFRLRAAWVIHAVGPVWRSGTAGEPEALRSAYLESLRLCGEKAIATVAFPLISTGIYGFPLDPACRIALRAALDWAATRDLPREITFVAFGDLALAALEGAWAEMAH
jgi:O-acetyl-ADP-ribose deacetylase (regulator of RNase III)